MTGDGWPGVVTNFSITFCAFILFFVFSFNIGKVHVTLVDMVPYFWTNLDSARVFREIATQKETVFWNVRLPRSILASTVGAALSVAGAVMQTLYRNPGLARCNRRNPGGEFRRRLAIFFFRAQSVCAGIFFLLRRVRFC